MSMENLELAIEQIKTELPGMTLLENEPLKQHCSFRIGGPARAIAVPSDVSSVSRICCILKEHKLAPMMLGNGTAPETPRRASHSPSWQASPSRTALKAWNLPPASRGRWAAAAA